MTRDDRGAILEVRAGARRRRSRALRERLVSHVPSTHASAGGADVLNVPRRKDEACAGFGRGSSTKRCSAQCQSGVHRGNACETETQGRVHTSTASVAVLPHAEEVDMDVRDEDVRVDTMRRAGGRQHANTTNSGAPDACPAGFVVIQDERSQHKNKAKAFSVESRLYDRERSNSERVRRAKFGLSARAIGNGFARITSRRVASRIIDRRRRVDDGRRQALMTVSPR